MNLVQELNHFLRASATISEQVSDALLMQISVRTALQERVESHVRGGGSLILSGTAGSGKTHLIRSLKSSVGLDGHLVCEDLASAPRKSWEQIGLFENPTIVAANEGALLDAARSTSVATVYSEAVRLLHDMQIGNASKGRRPFLLVDMAAADAASTHSLGKMLSLPILREYADRQLSRAQAQAWRLLENEQIRDRLTALVASASAASDSGGFTYRQLWQFVGELIVPDDANTPWTYRVFNGSSKVSRAIQNTFPLGVFALPKAAARLWYRDLDFFNEKMSESALDVLWDYGQGTDWEAHMVRTSIAVFSMLESPIERVLEAPRDLWSSLAIQQDSSELIRAINRYLTYGLRTVGVDLELWVPTDLERRTSKPEAQVSLGTIPVAALEVRRNLIFSELDYDDDLGSYRGTRLSLYHRASGASLALSRDLVAALSGIRSHRPSDRAAVEYDWRLFKFIYRVATCGADGRGLHAVQLNFDQRESRTVYFELGDGRIVGEPR